MTRFNNTYTTKPGRRRIVAVRLTAKGKRYLPLDLKAQTALVALQHLHKITKKSVFTIDQAFSEIEKHLRLLNGVPDDCTLDSIIKIKKPKTQVFVEKTVYEVIYGKGGQYYWVMLLLSNLQVNGFVERLAVDGSVFGMKSLKQKASLVEPLKKALE